jgi:hypothetical protein
VSRAVYLGLGAAAVLAVAYFGYRYWVNTRDAAKTTAGQPSPNTVNGIPQTAAGVLGS